MEAKEYKPGDVVPESTSYVCDICHTEGGVEKTKLKKGDTFPQCSQCGRFTKWKKFPKGN